MTEKVDFHIRLSEVMLHRKQYLTINLCSHTRFTIVGTIINDVCKPKRNHAFAHVCHYLSNTWNSPVGDDDIIRPTVML